MAVIYSIVGTRHLILLASTLCMTSILSNMATYNFTKICISNETSSHNGQNYTKAQKSMLQSFVAVGALSTSIPFAYIYPKFSPRHLFVLAGALSAIATAIIPLANSGGFGYFLCARIFQGVAFVAVFPVLASLITEWAPLTEHGVFLAMSTGCTQLSNIFTMPVSGALCSSEWGWPAVYYVHAIIALLVFGFFYICFRDKPEEHTWVNLAELQKIKENKKNEVTHENVPYKKILLSLTIWGIWIAATGDLLSVQLVSMFNPQYMKDYLNYDILNTGIMAALPVIVQFIVKCFAGIITDALYCFSETFKVRLFNTIALGVSGFAFIALAFMNNSNPAINMIILIFTESMIGFNTAGFNKCATLHSRQFSHFVMNQVTNIWAMCILIEPFIVQPILGDGGYVGWRNTYLLHAAILLATNLIFCLFADAKAAKWTKVETEQPPPVLDLKLFETLQ